MRTHEWLGLNLANYRSREAVAWRKLYKSAAWQAKRTEQLQREPLCKFCLEVGRVKAATVADHVIPHKGDLTLFFEGETQSLCAVCHNAAKQQIERGGFHSAADADGYPIDQNHPVNRPRKTTSQIA